MAYTTDAALLQEVRDAIQALINGKAQSYTINMGGGTRAVTKLDLSELMELEQALVIRVQRASRGSFGVVKFGAAQ